MIKLILLVTIIIFYCIRWRPSVLRRIDKKRINVQLLIGEILILCLIVFQLTDMDKFKFHVPTWINYAGLALSLAGALIASVARISLKKNYMPATVSTAPDTLTTNGLYKIVRHPSYAGTLLAFIGFEIALNSYLIFIFVILLMLLVKQINKEEKMLLEIYENEWSDFVKKTPYRLIPFVY